MIIRYWVVVVFLFIMAAPARSADLHDFRENWLKLLKDGDPRERSMAIESLGFPDCRTKEGMEHLKLLERYGLQDSSSLVRETALARLRFTLSPDHHGGCKANDELIAALVDALKDSPSRSKEESVRILGMSRTMQAVSEIYPLLHDNDLIVRQQAALALGRIGDKNALPHLLDLLAERKRWQDALVQQEALYSIRKIVAAHLKTYIIQFNSGDKIEEKNQIDTGLLDKVKEAIIVAAGDPWLRHEAFEFFASVTTPAARTVLQSATGDSDPSIRKLAFDGVSRIDRLVPQKHSCGYESVARALKDPSPAMRSAALGRLPDCSGEVDATTLSAHLVGGINDADQNVGIIAIGVAPSVGGADILNALAGKFDMVPYEARKKVMGSYLAIALGDMSQTIPATTGSEVTKKAKNRFRNTDNNVVVIKAVEGRPPTAEGFGVVDSVTKTITSVPSQNSLETQTNTAPEKTVSSLQVPALEIILSRFPSLSLAGKLTAMEVLEKLNDPKIRLFAISLLDDSQPRVRSKAIILASKFGAETILPQLFKCAQDKDSDVRYSALRGLTEVENLPETYSLMKLADNPDPAVRITLSNEIQQYLVRHNDKVRPDQKLLIEKMLDDPDFEVRQRVTSYFQKVFDKESIEKLAQILTRDGVCSNAAFALAGQGDIRGRDALYEVGKGACNVKNDWRNPGKKIWAATALTKSKDPRATPLLCSLLEQAEGNEPYELIIQLGETRDENAVSCLVAYGKTTKSYRRELMSAFHKISSPKSLDFLKSSLDVYQYDTEALKDAVKAIAGIPGTASLDILIDEIRNNSKISNEMRSALSDRAMCDNMALSYLFKIVGKEQSLRSIAVAIGFKASGVMPWRKLVVTLVNDKDANVQSGAIIALSSFHDDESLSLLEKLTTENTKLAILAQQSLEIRNKRKNCIQNKVGHQ